MAERLEVLEYRVGKGVCDIVILRPNLPGSGDTYGGRPGHEIMYHFWHNEIKTFNKKREYIEDTLGFKPVEISLYKHV